MSAEPLFIAKGASEIYLLPRMANRHGLITGATGTGKTVSLQVMAENFSRIGVPVFMADVKGDLTGISKAGAENPKIGERLDKLKLRPFEFSGKPVVCWDIFGEQGHPVRTTISDMGPLLLSRLFNLSDIQAGVLSLVFKVADDNGLLLLDTKDLRAILQYCGDHADEFETEYGRISSASVGAIQRSLLNLESQGGDKLFGEPALNLDDFIQTDSQGRGVINILAADKLMLQPMTYATFLLWMLAELYENLPEVGDLEKPKLVFFFDEAHLLFTDAPDILLQKVEQIIRLIRSKGVGVYFVTQNPLDVPDIALGQLGNRIQHALRAFTPRDQKAVRAAATTFRANPKIDVEKTITELGVGEALVSFLDEKGQPGIVDRAYILPPHSQIGPISEDERRRIIENSVLYGHYEKLIDRESAYERLKEKARLAEEAAAAEHAARYPTPMGYPQGPSTDQPRAPRPVGRPRDTFVESVGKSVVRSLATSTGRQIIRGLLGSILGGRRR
ncbi:MAG: helicase HerA-like domain-containing protein [Candidatus Aminicenantales bacterium]